MKYMLSSKYPIYLHNKNNGTIITKWKTHHKFARGKIFKRNAFVNGIPIVEHDDHLSDNSKVNFDIRSRIIITPIDNKDATTTSIVTFVFQVAPYDLTYKEYDQDQFANKIFSKSGFDPLEERKLLDALKADISKNAYIFYDSKEGC